MTVTSTILALIIIAWVLFNWRKIEMKKSNWKLVLIIVAGILAVVMTGVFGVQSSQNKAFSLEEQVNTADSDIKVQEKDVWI